MPTSTDPTIPSTLELVDGRLQLRCWRDSDATALLDAARESIDSVGRWLPWCNASYGPNEATAWVMHCQKGWRSGAHFAFSIFDAVSGELLGSAGLSQHNRLHRSANLGYWVRQSRHGQGVATAAATLVARFGFERLELARIEVVILPDNQPSRRIAEKIGAKFETIVPRRLWLHEQPRDAAVYALTRQTPG